MEEDNIKNDLGCTRIYNDISRLFVWNSKYTEIFCVPFFLIKTFSDILNFQLVNKLEEICKCLS
jgi:hypothetical protein